MLGIIIYLIVFFPLKWKRVWGYENGFFCLKKMSNSLKKEKVP